MKHVSPLAHLLSLCLLAVVLIGCTKPQAAPTTQSKPIRVVATTGMVADLVRRIGATHVDVEQLIRSGVDPHLYRPNSDDVKSLKRADLVFYNGLKLEGRMGDALESASNRTKSVAVAESIRDKLAPEFSHEGTQDPHVWMDVQLWSDVSKSVEKTLVEKDPEHADEYRANAERLRAECMELDQRAIRWMASIPESRRVLISSHDAFRYFGKRYGVQVEGIQGISTSSEAGLKRIEELVNLLVSKKIPAVFIESSVPEKGVRSLIEGAAQKGWKVELGGTLFTDAMGEDGTDQATYLGMMEHNFRTIVTSLGGATE